MNVVDRIVSYVNPEAGIRRERARLMLQQVARIKNTGYSEGGASTGKNYARGWNDRGGSPDDDIGANLPKLVQRSRALFMTSPIGRAALRRFRTNTVGPGLKLRSIPNIDILGISQEEASAAARRFMQEFSLWADSVDCDVARQNNFAQLTQLAALSWPLSGDVFALLPIIPKAGQPYDLRIQLIEADRVCDPKPKPDADVKNGVELAPTGEVVAYWVAQWHPLSREAKIAHKNEWQRVTVRGRKSGRRNILHLMESERPEQRRGVPMLSPVIEALKGLTRYSDTELTAAVVASLFTVFVKSQTPQSPLGESVLDVQKVTRGMIDEDLQYELGPGAMIGLADNEDITIANPGRPNTAFEAFVNSIITEIGAALEIPFEVLTLRFNSSYSASRAALLEFWKLIRMWRTWLATDFCQPIYEEWFYEAVSKGRIDAPGFFDDPLIAAAWMRAEWHGPTPGQIDPLKEVNAAKLRVDEGFSTRARETAELNGGDFEANMAQRMVEEQMMAKAGLGGPPEKASR